MGVWSDNFYTADTPIIETVFNYNDNVSIQYSIKIVEVIKVKLKGNISGLDKCL